MRTEVKNTIHRGVAGTVIGISLMASACSRDGSDDGARQPADSPATASDTGSTEPTNIAPTPSTERTEMSLPPAPTTSVETEQIVGRRWNVGEDPAATLDVGPMGTGKILGNSIPANEIVVSVIEAPPLVGSSLGGSYILLFASRDGGAWVVTHELSLDLNDDEQLSLSHEQCTQNGTYTADLMAVLTPPVVDGVVDLAARKWHATQAWRYSAGELTKQAPENVACSLTGE